MKQALLFPGQGSQTVGMGQDHYQQNDRFKELCDQANEILGIELTEIMFEGPSDKLRQTEYTQPAIFLHSVALFETLDLTPDMVAGHSLGEFSALYAAGVLSFEDALKTVRRRGELMQNAGTQNEGTMAAVIGMEDEKVKRICDQASEEMDLEVLAANFNCPGQVVISGYVQAVDRAIEIAKEHGVRLAKKLPVSGAFHSSLMMPAHEGLAERLNDMSFSDPSCPVYSNYTAEATTDAGQIKSNLLDQLLNPVLWTQTVRNMKEDGAQRFVEVGPGKVLQGLVKRTIKDVEVKGFE